jgi:thiol-disulfide isomerase/thioredoxin
LRPDSQEARNALADASAGRFRRTPSAGVPAGAPAPVVEIDRMGGGRLRLPPIDRGRPAVLVFGSYTCPQFRSAAAQLERLSTEYRAQANFVLVYIREAHAGEQWQSTINDRERVSLGPADTLAQKREHAMVCVRKLRLSFPAAVDRMDGAAEKAYEAWPSRVYVVGSDGTVRYSSGLGDFEFDGNALAEAIREAVRGSRR